MCVRRKLVMFLVCMVKGEMSFVNGFIADTFLTIYSQITFLYTIYYTLHFEKFKQKSEILR